MRGRGEEHVDAVDVEEEMDVREGLEMFVRLLAAAGAWVFGARGVGVGGVEPAGCAS